MATLPGRVITSSILQSTKGFDTDDVVSLKTAKAFVADGYSFCVRYVSRGDTESSGDLSNSEAEGILMSGLALMVVQHVSKSGWKPTAKLGKEYGTNAAAHAKKIGVLEGVNLWCDLEGVSSDATDSDIIAYCNNWADSVSGAGYRPGLYVGASCRLSGTQLYEKLSFSHYWKSASKVPAVETRGYAMTQTSIDKSAHGK